MNCDNCTNRATQILSVGSLGRVERLCPGCVQVAVRPLEASLIPFQLTGTEGSYTAEQALEQIVRQLNADNTALTLQITDARNENRRLRELLANRIEAENENLRAELDELKTENERLALEAEAEETHNPPAVVEGQQQQT